MRLKVVDEIANNVDPDQTAATGLGLHCLSTLVRYFNTTIGMMIRP